MSSLKEKKKQNLISVWRKWSLDEAVENLEKN